jgi:hypothetical protein
MATKRASPTRRPKVVQNESNSSQKARSSKRRMARGVTKSKILAHLGLADGRSVLLVLAERHPELLPEIEDIIREDSATVTPQDIADEVVAAIAELTIFDMGRNQSTEPFQYKGETESAWGVFSETLAPFVETISRQARMGLVEAALAHCEGVLLGLYSAERDWVSELLDWIPDGVPELADEPLQALAPVRRRRLGGTSLTAGKALKEFALQHLPEWRWLQN